jgi:hypothetical protein
MAAMPPKKCSKMLTSLRGLFDVPRDICYLIQPTARCRSGRGRRAPLWGQ